MPIPRKLNQIRVILRKLLGPVYYQFPTVIFGSKMDIPLKFFFMKMMHLQSKILTCQKRGIYTQTDTFCLFLGLPRSGASILGAILDAHPQVNIAHELGVLDLIESGKFTREQLFALILANSKAQSFLTKRRHKETGIKENWNGRTDMLKIIGDKHAWRSTMLMGEDPGKLKHVREITGLRVKLIHQIRNPYDVISTMFNKRQGNETLRDIINEFFMLCDRIECIRKKIPKEDLFEGRHEVFVAEPIGYLNELFRFLGSVEPGERYLKNCMGVIYKSANKSRENVVWDDEFKSWVASGIRKYSFLDGYTFDN